MRKALILIGLVACCALPLQAANNIMIGIDSVPNYVTEFYVPFLYESDVPLAAFSNGYTIAASGDITAWFEPQQIQADSGRFNYFIITFSAYTVPNYTQPSDSILAGGCPTFAGGDPLPAGPLEWLFSNQVLVTKLQPSSEGEICIDSVIKVGAAGDWLLE